LVRRICDGYKALFDGFLGLAKHVVDEKGGLGVETTCLYLTTIGSLVLQVAFEAMLQVIGLGREVAGAAILGSLEDGRGGGGARDTSSRVAEYDRAMEVVFSLYSELLKYMMRRFSDFVSLYKDAGCDRMVLFQGGQL